MLIRADGPTAIELLDGQPTAVAATAAAGEPSYINPSLA